MTNYTPEQRAAVVEELERLENALHCEQWESGRIHPKQYTKGLWFGQKAAAARIRELKETPDEQ